MDIVTRQWHPNDPMRMIRVTKAIPGYLISTQRWLANPKQVGRLLGALQCSVSFIVFSMHHI